MRNVSALVRALCAASLAVSTLATVGCSGGGSDSSAAVVPPPSPPAPPPAAIEGIATPSSVAVVTATNAD